jgi:hypothetical protein
MNPSKQAPVSRPINARAGEITAARIKTTEF